MDFSIVYLIILNGRRDPPIDREPGGGKGCVKNSSSLTVFEIFNI